MTLSYKIQQTKQRSYALWKSFLTNYGWSTNPTRSQTLPVTTPFDLIGFIVSNNHTYRDILANNKKSMPLLKGRKWCVDPIKFQL